MEIEKQVRMSIRDALNRSSRRPFCWGGLAGYQQLEAISEALHKIPDGPDTAYLHQLTSQIDRALTQNRSLAQDVEEAQAWLIRLAGCLHYPPSSPSSQDASVTSQQVRRAVEDLLSEFQVGPYKPAQAALYGAWRRLWKTWAPDLLHCYDVPGLPADNSKIESFFGRLRHHQRRISGCKSTGPLRYFGQYQALFTAEDEQDLLAQIRKVSQREYRTHRRRLEKSESIRRHQQRLHRNPAQAMQQLLAQHSARRSALAADEDSLPP